MRRVQIRRKEAAKLIESAKNQRISFKKEDFGVAEVAEIEDFKILLLDGVASLIVFPDGKIIPHLHGLGRVTICPVVVVDKGALKHVLNGADVMMPGIVKYSEFKEEDPVVVISEEYVVLAVGIALQDSSSIVKGGKGKVVKNIHRPNDVFSRSISS
ncbi:MAG: DUF1947 domain-containing protein [Thermoproteota archaeon]